MVCECPKDENGKYVTDLDLIIIEDYFDLEDQRDEEGNLLPEKRKRYMGKRAVINKAAQPKEKRFDKEIRDAKAQVDSLKQIDWDTAKIADVRKAIKFLLGVE